VKTLEIRFNTEEDTCESISFRKPQMLPGALVTWLDAQIPGTYMNRLRITDAASGDKADSIPDIRSLVEVTEVTHEEFPSKIVASKQ